MATADSLSVQSFAIIKNIGHGNFVIGRFQTRTRNGLSVWDWPVHSRPLPHRHPFSDFFWGDGAAVHRLSETDNPSSNCPSKLTDKVRRIVHSKLKPFHFQIKRYYTHECRAAASSWAFACLLLTFLWAINIRSGIFYKKLSIIYQMLKFSKE